MMYAQRMPGACSLHARSMLTAMHWACSRDARLCASARTRARAQRTEVRGFLILNRYCSQSVAPPAARARVQTDRPEVLR